MNTKRRILTMFVFNRKGFALSGLLLVVSLVFSHLTGMNPVEMELNKVVSAAKVHFEKYGTYIDYKVPESSNGVIIVVSEATRTGWSATAVHYETRVYCQVGLGTERVPGISEGEIGGTSC